MKRREFIKVAGTGVAASVLAKPAIAQSTPELRWRLTSSFPKSLDTLYGASEIFAKAVAEASDNKFKSKYLPQVRLCPDLQPLMPCKAARSRCATPHRIITLEKIRRSHSA